MSKTLPGLGLKGGFADKEKGWGPDMNANVAKLSALVQASVIGRVAAVPGAPAANDRYVLTAAPNAQAIAVFETDAWVYYAPEEGWSVYDRDKNLLITFDGAAWKEAAGNGGGSGYRIGGFFTTAPGANEVVLMHVAAEAFTLPALLAGSVVKVGTNPSAATTFSIAKNGQGVATMVIAANGNTTFTGDQVAVAVGDLLTITAPAAANGVANTAFTLKGV